MYKAKTNLSLDSFIRMFLIILKCLFTFSLSSALLYSKNEIISEMNKLDSTLSISTLQLPKLFSKSCKNHEIILSNVSIKSKKCPMVYIWNINPCRSPPVYLEMRCSFRNHQNFNNCRDKFIIRLSKSVRMSSSGNSFHFGDVYEKFGVGCTYNKQIF